MATEMILVYCYLVHLIKIKNAILKVFYIKLYIETVCLANEIEFEIVRICLFSVLRNAEAIGLPDVLFVTKEEK